MDGRVEKFDRLSSFYLSVWLFLDSLSAEPASRWLMMASPEETKALVSRDSLEHQCKRALDSVKDPELAESLWRDFERVEKLREKPPQETEDWKLWLKDVERQKTRFLELGLYFAEKMAEFV